MDAHCPICERRKEESSELCEVHGAAWQNLENAYANWNRAYGGSLTKELYFTKVEGLGETGQAVKDVIKYLRRKGPTQCEQR